MKRFQFVLGPVCAVVILAMMSNVVLAQTAPSNTQISAYRGLHRAAQLGDVKVIGELLKSGADIKATDQAGRTPLHVAAFASRYDVVKALAKAGANLNALENDAYDIVTIAAVANDLKMVDLALKLGANPGSITSRYDGTALIAAAHLGHHKVVKRLIEAGAPLDHINNLGWTALIEAVVLGDGGPNHVATAKHLVKAGANKSIGDRQGMTPLDLAKSAGYKNMIEVLK